MPNQSSDLRQEMIELLGRIVGPGPLPADSQRSALEMLASVMTPPARPPDQALAAAAPGAALLAAAAPGALVLAAAPVITRRLIYVHGICRHPAGFSDPWWSSLHPFVPSDFGDGTLGVTRLEVLWSDVVDQASAALAAVGGAALPAGAAGPEQARQRAFAEIAEALRDRADQQLLGATMRTGALAAAPLGAADTSGLITIPGLNCVEDFSIYLIDDGVRQRILNRFIDVVKPELQAGHELDIVAHSWGTVVAYEGLRQLEDEGLAARGAKPLHCGSRALDRSGETAPADSQPGRPEAGKRPTLGQSERSRRYRGRTAQRPAVRGRPGFPQSRRGRLRQLPRAGQSGVCPWLLLCERQFRSESGHLRPVHRSILNGAAGTCHNRTSRTRYDRSDAATRPGLASDGGGGRSGRPPSLRSPPMAAAAPPGPGSRLGLRRSQPGRDRAGHPRKRRGRRRPVE